MSRREIINCGQVERINFHFICPMKWEELDEMDSTNLRWCQECEKRVYWCHDTLEAGIRAEQNECIAVPAWFADGVREDPPSQVILGMPNYTDRFRKVAETYQQSNAKK